jgi:hypothetical protein
MADLAVVVRRLGVPPRKSPIRVHPRHGEGTGDRLELVLLDRDADRNGALERPGVGATSSCEERAGSNFFIWPLSLTIWT